jgi:translation initiation factor 2B subunit (eIF-2B alpha/beta/delta family)
VTTGAVTCLVPSEPTVADVVEDTEHGSAWISTRALEVLGRRAEAAGRWEPLATLARELRGSHPDMAALANRINRAMARATRQDLEEPARTPAAVAAATERTLAEAQKADEGAAKRAATVLDDCDTVATLSRSGTVSRALVEAEPTVLIGESRPAGEGIEVAAELAAAGLAVTLTTDAALPWALSRESVRATAVDGPVPDAVVVGADAVLPDGTVVNKAGTRSLGLAASRADVPLYVVAASDKVATDDRIPTDQSDPGPLTAAPDVRTWTPTFDRTPPDCVDGIVTEDGTLTTAEVRDVAEQHRRNAAWDASTEN